MTEPAAPPTGTPPSTGHTNEYYAGLSKEILRDATSILNFARQGMTASYNYDHAESIYQQQLQNLQERVGSLTEDAYARATMQAAQDLIAHHHTTEELAAAQLMMRNLENDTARRRRTARESAAASAAFRTKLWQYSLAGVAVAALVGGVWYMERKKRGSRSTRPAEAK